MKDKFIDKKIVLNLRYIKSKSDFNKNYFIGGLEEPKYLNELLLDIYDDIEYNLDNDTFEKSGKMVLEISGSDRSLFELGKYLINISTYETSDPDFHEHFDNLKNSTGKNKVNLIVRKKLDIAHNNK